MESPKVVAVLSSDTDVIRLRTQTEFLSFSGVKKPSWAQTMGRDQQGLFVELEQRGTFFRLYWPEWGSDLGYDQYGLYADLTIKNVTQRFRWINSGIFFMGSPVIASEEVNVRETRHQVTLTQGCWLADSSCTQALWEIVMNENLSAFQNDINNPVEQVSWNDAQQFIKKLNWLIPGLNASLPTEALWEYACRAETETLFSFGQSIDTDKVNFNPHYDYRKYKKTVPVKSLPANSWGLYEMHGNVMEWCLDWYGDYPSYPVTNPVGSPRGTARVLRGGSWIDRQFNVRSASRGRHQDNDRNNIFGFRLALAQKNP